MGVVIGARMRAYRKLASDWVLMTNIKNLSRAQPIDEADVSTRGSYPHKATEPTFQDWSSDWNMNYDEEDPDFLAIKTAFDTRAPLELAFSSGDIEEDGTLYFHVPAAKFFKFDIDEPLTDVSDVAVTAKNSSTTNPPKWEIVGEEESGSGSGA